MDRRDWGERVLPRMERPVFRGIGYAFWLLFAAVIASPLAAFPDPWGWALVVAVGSVVFLLGLRALRQVAPRSDE